MEDSRFGTEEIEGELWFSLVVLHPRVEVFSGVFKGFERGVDIGDAGLLIGAMTEVLVEGVADLFFVAEQEVDTTVNAVNSSFCKDGKLLMEGFALAFEQATHLCGLAIGAVSRFLVGRDDAEAGDG